MIYKVIGELSSYEKVLQSIQDKGYNYVYYNSTLYVACSDPDESDDFKTNIHKYFKTNCYVKEINVTDIDFEPPKIQQWCESENYIYGLKLAEKENQKALKKLLNQIDLLDHEIFKERG